MISSILNWLQFIAIELGRNYIGIKYDKEKPIYIQSFVFRALAGIIIARVSDPELLWTNILDAAPFIVFEVTSFYLLFDPILNKLLGNKWLYKGLESGYLDKLPIWAYLSIKIVCVPALIWSLFNL